MGLSDRQRWSTAFILAVLLTLPAWTPLTVSQDRNVFMPGSQQGSVNLESVTRCDNCHGGYDQAAEPAFNWHGSMMAQAARDPLWLATMTVALQDSIWQLGNPNAGDLCIRCHSPGGWLGGRSEPVNTSALTGSDYEGVTCDFCHRSVDPFNELKQSRDDVPAETTTEGQTAAADTYAADNDVLSTLQLFDGTAFFDSSTRLPVHYGSGTLPDYVESTGGQFVVDTVQDKRGPRFNVSPNHNFYYSRFHKSKYFCGTCHDVSNPALANALIGQGTAEQQAAASYFHVERTFSEFMLSAYGRDGGAATNVGMNVPWAAKCQDCHMRDVSGKLCNKNVPVRSDMALHDLTGGNTWMLDILASVDQSSASYDSYNYEILSGVKYPHAKVDVGGVQNRGTALSAGSARALAQLEMAATFELVVDESASVTLRIINNTGHKLISGYPEGRRMWLNVKFFDGGQNVIGEINPYTPLATSLDANGNEQYVSGGDLSPTRPDLVYEANMSSSLTDESKTFHFVLATGRYKDNRIPPKGFDIDNAADRLTVPHWQGAAEPAMYDSAEYAGGYDEITFEKPVGTASWTASLYYQTTSREYIEFLRNEINGTASTLSSPTPSGESEAYIIQTDPFFDTLKSWGDAMWDLWLHNEGAPPVLMTQLSSLSAPSGVAASAVTASEISVTWNGVSGAASYEVYRRDPGTGYALLGSVTGTSYSDTTPTTGTAYLYAVKALDGSGNRSALSNPDLATAVVFTDPTLSSGVTTVKAVHLTELRGAVEAVRALAGLEGYGFTDPTITPGSTYIRSAHISDLRTALDAARSSLSLSSGGYTDVSVSGLPVKAVHFTELRDGVQ